MSVPSQEIFQKIVNVLIPHCTDTPSRQSLVTLSLSDCKVAEQLDFSGTAQVFVVHLVTTLLRYGECQQGKLAIIALLEQLRNQVGHNYQADIDQLIAVIPDDIAALVLVDSTIVAIAKHEDQKIIETSSKSYNLGDISNSTIAVGEHISINIGEDRKIKQLEREIKDLEELKKAVNHKLKKARDDATVARNVRHIKQQSQAPVMTALVPLATIAGVSLFVFAIEPIFGLGAGIIGLAAFWRYRTNHSKKTEAPNLNDAVETLKAEINTIEAQIQSKKNEIRRLDLEGN